jgi:hypothetical protein
MRWLLPVFANLVLVLSAFGFGGLLRGLFPKSFSPIDRLTLTLLGGIGLLGTILFCVGQVLFATVAIVLILALGVALGFGSFVILVKEVRAILVARPAPIIPVGVIVIIMMITAVGGLAEPVGDMNDDAIAYHYLGPKVWLRDGLIRPVADEGPTSFPVVVETEYAALMAVGGQRAPQFFAVVSVVAVLLIAASLAARSRLGASGAWWTAALVASMPAVYRGAFGGFIDALCAAFILGAARIAFDAEELSEYLLVGVFCGIAIGTKYTSLVACTLIALCLFFVSTWVHHFSYRTILNRLAVAGGVAVAVGCPVYIRNWLILGCPIYPPPPYLNQFFQAKYLSAEAVRSLHAYMYVRGAGLGRGLKAYLLLPINLTYHTANFHGAGGIGLTPLALGPLGLLRARRARFPTILSAFAVLSTTAWFFTQQESRFLIHVYVISAVVAVLGWEYVGDVSSKYAKSLANVIVGLSIAYGLVMIIPARVEDLHSAVSIDYEARRRKAEVPFIESIIYLNEEPGVTKTLVLDPFSPAYFLGKPYLKPIGRWGEQTLPEAADRQRLPQTLEGLRVSHILDVRRASVPFVLPDNPPGLTLVLEQENQRVYTVDWR